jgi:hypothetical protein
MAKMKKPPFGVNGKLPDETYAGEFELRIHRRQKPLIDPFTSQPFSLEPSMEMVRNFQLAVNTQLFNPDPKAARRAELVPLSVDGGPMSDLLSYHYRIDRVPPMSFLILLSMLSQTRYANDPIDHVELSVMDAKGPHLTPAAVLSLPRRVARVTPAPFGIDIDANLFDNDSFEVTIDFVKPLSRDEFMRVRSGLAVWDELRLVGGFLLDFSEQEDPGSPSNIVHISPRSVHLESMDFYEGEPEMLNCLINYAALLDADGLRVEQFAAE